MGVGYPGQRVLAVNAAHEVETINRVQYVSADQNLYYRLDAATINLGRGNDCPEGAPTLPCP
jgi:hypothetical protein